jgi:hypothetical protein
MKLPAFPPAAPFPIVAGNNNGTANIVPKQ